ncbi:hypothetical protein DFH09DRAFT_1456802, partial [Mycena vulgaris]
AATTSGAGCSSGPSTAPEHRTRDAARLSTRHTPRRMCCATATSDVPYHTHTLDTTPTHTVAPISTPTRTPSMRRSCSSPPPPPPSPPRPPRPSPAQFRPAARIPSPPCTVNHDAHHRPLAQWLPRPSLVAGAASIISARAQGIFTHGDGVPHRPRHLRHLRHLATQCTSRPTQPPRTTIDAGGPPHTRRPACAHREDDAQRFRHTQLTPPPLSIERAVFITCPFAATIIIAIRPSRLTPAPLVHSPARRPFVITGAALLAPTRATTIGSSESASIHNVRARAHPQYEAHHHRGAHRLFLIPNVAGVAPLHTATIHSVTPIPGAKSVFV